MNLMFRTIALLCALQCAVAPAYAGSSIDTTVPVQGAPFASAPIRSNFTKAASDIVALQSRNAGPMQPSGLSNFQDWANTAGCPTACVIMTYDGTVPVRVGTLNQSTHVFGAALSSASVSASAPFTASFSGGVGTFGIANGTSVLNPGTGTLEYVLPVETNIANGGSCTTNCVYTALDLFKKVRRSNSGVAMSDTLPASTAVGMVNGARITIGNVDATATLALTAGSGTTIAVTSIGPGRTLPLVYDLPNTAWRIDDNAAAALLLTGSAVSGNLPIFNGTAGLLGDSGYSPTTLPFTVGTTPVSGGTPNCILYDVANIGQCWTTTPNGAPALIQNMFGGQFVGVPVDFFGAKNDEVTLNTNAVVQAATYANTNHVGIIYTSGGGYLQTPMQFGGSYPATGTFTGTISNGSGGSGTILAVTSTPTVPLTPGQSLTCSGCSAGSKVTAFGNQTGGWIGTYTITPAQLVASPVTITATAPSFTATFAGSVMTVTAIANGTINAVDSLVGTTATQIIPGTTITGNASTNSGACSPACTGAGGAGTYGVSYPQTVASTTVRSYPLTVAPIPTGINGGVGGETQTVILPYGSIAVPTPLVKIVDPPVLSAVAGFNMGNLKIHGLSLTGNALEIHGLSALGPGGGIPYIHNLTLSGGTASTCGLYLVGNGVGAAYSIIDARFSDISMIFNSVCDMRSDGNNGDGSFNIQSVIFEKFSLNSASTGNGADFDYTNALLPEFLSQDHGGAPININHANHLLFDNGYSEANGTSFSIDATNSRNVMLWNGQWLEGVNSAMQACTTCKTHVYIGGGTTLIYDGAVNPTSITLNGNAEDTAGGVLVPSNGSASGQLLLGLTANSPQWETMSGDATIASTGTLTLSAVNSNVGSFGNSTQVPQITVNAKGLATGASNVTVTPAISSVTGLGTGVATALAVNPGTAGSLVVNGGALGTPSAGVATNLTGTAAGLTAGAANSAPLSGITGIATNCPAWLAAASSANLAACLTDETGTGAAVFANGGTLNQPNIVGVTSGGNAATGSVGEYLSATSISTPTSLATSTPTNTASLALPAGDYNCGGVAGFVPQATTNMTFLAGSLSTTTGSLGAAGSARYQDVYGSAGRVPGNLNNIEYPLPEIRVSSSGSTTVFEVSDVVWTAAGLNGYGSIWCRRIR